MNKRQYGCMINEPLQKFRSSLYLFIIILLYQCILFMSFSFLAIPKAFIFVHVFVNDSMFK